MQRSRRGGTTIAVDVEPVGRHADGRNRGAEFTQHGRCHLIRRAVGGVDHDLHAAQVEPTAQRPLAELDVPPAGVHGTPRLANLGRRDQGQRLVETAFDLRFERIGQLLAAGGEQLDAVVRIGVVRSADNDARARVEGAREVRHRRRRHRPEQQAIHAGGRQAGLQR